MNDFMACKFINALNNFLEIFESKDSTCVQSKNISIITKQLHAAVVSLDEVAILPDETYGVILHDITKYSNEDFEQSASTF